MSRAVPAGSIALATVLVLVPVRGDAAIGDVLVLLCLAAGTAVAVRVRSAPAVRALGVLTAVLMVFAAGRVVDLPPAVTTVLVCAAPLVVLLGCGRAGWLRPARPWLRAGRVTVGMAAFGLLTVVLSGAALSLWAVLADPAAPAYLADLQERPVWVGIAGVIGFALVNPVWEELVFRGVLLHELGELAGVRAAVVAQALLFGAAHWAGFPSGLAGTVMAAGWGLALGVIRVRTRGLLLPYAVHACADATIGALALLVLT